MSRSLSSLQRAVIDRLRQFGHHALAEEASEAWARGQRLVAYQVGRSVGDSELPGDFERANRAATESRMEESPSRYRLVTDKPSRERTEDGDN